MKGRSLKLYLLSSLLLSFSIVVKAQNFQYIYIQTENQKPFYVKINGQTISSSSSGYIIIPRLTQGLLKSYIGFPKTELPELAINFIINDADAGYLLKNDVDQGLYMVDLLTNKFIPTERFWPTVKNTIKSKDDFAKILSEVVNDSSINEITVFKKPVEAIVKPEANNTLNTSEEVQPQIVIENKSESITDNKVMITKLGQKNTAEGLSVNYVDDVDTIDVFIPVNKVQTQAVKEEKSEPLPVVKKEDEAVKDIKFIDIELRNPNQQADSASIKKDDFVINEKKNNAAIASEMNQRDSIAKLKADSRKVNTACKKTATQTDFLNLRKQMAAEKTEADMQKIALIKFSGTCFITEQIRNLGVLFITDEGKYKFYVAAYPYVSDIENFAALQSQLADNYYIDRFKAMLTH